VKGGERFEMSKALSDRYEHEVADELDVGGQNRLLEVASLVAEVHENKHDVSGFDQSQHNE
jgi:hypothetical protein